MRCQPSFPFPYPCWLPEPSLGSIPSVPTSAPYCLCPICQPCLSNHSLQSHSALTTVLPQFPASAALIDPLPTLFWPRTLPMVLMNMTLPSGSWMALKTPVTQLRPLHSGSARGQSPPELAPRLPLQVRSHSHLYICPFIHPFIYPSIHLSPSICLSHHIPIHPSTHLSHPSVHLPIHSMSCVFRATLGVHS